MSHESAIGVIKNQMAWIRIEKQNAERAFQESTQQVLKAHERIDRVDKELKDLEDTLEFLENNVYNDD